MYYKSLENRPYEKNYIDLLIDEARAELALKQSEKKKKQDADDDMIAEIIKEYRKKRINKIERE